VNRGNQYCFISDIKGNQRTISCFTPSKLFLLIWIAVKSQGVEIRSWNSANQVSSICSKKRGGSGVNNVAPMRFKCGRRTAHGWAPKFSSFRAKRCNQRFPLRDSILHRHSSRAFATRTVRLFVTQNVWWSRGQMFERL